MMIYQFSKAVLKGSAMAYLPKTITSCILVSGTLAMTSMPAFAVEPWIMVQRTEFNGPARDSKPQGVTTDGTNWYFSSTNSLETTDTNYNSELKVSPAIPDELANSRPSIPRAAPTT